ncbi:MAG: hypothetical protein ACRDOD_23715, partial [Streptosporangiaceae bacterium]
MTGEGLVRRALYTDSGLSVLSFRRAIILTAIDAGSLRGDLADRLLLVDLERIPPGRRRRDRELEAAFAEARPRVLGALLDLAAQVLTVLPDTNPASLPRMADFAVVLAALDRLLGTDAFMHYSESGSRLAAEVVEGDLVAQAVVTFARERQVWSGTAAELLAEIIPDRPPRGWPATPNHLSGRIKRAAPALRELGVGVEVTREGKERRRLLRLEVADARRTLNGSADAKADAHLNSVDAADGHLPLISGVADAERGGHGGLDSLLKEGEGEGVGILASAPSAASADALDDDYQAALDAHL